MRTILFLLLAISLFAGPPMLSNDPFVPDLGQFEINLAAEFEDRDATIVTAPIIDFNYGLIKDVQFTVEGAYVTSEEQGDFDALELAIKWNFYQDDFFAIAIYPQYLSYPTDSIFDEGEVFALSIPMSFALADDLRWVVDISYVRAEDAEHMEMGSYLQYSYSEHDFYFEAYSEEGEHDHERLLLLQLGYLYQFHDNVAFMIALGREIHAEEKKAIIGYSGLQFVF